MNAAYRRKRLRSTGKRRKQLSARAAGVALTLIFTGSVVALACGSGSLGRIASAAAMLSAKMTMPQGGSRVLTDKLRQIEAILSASGQEAKTAGTDVSSGSSSSSAVSSSQTSSSSKTGSGKIPAGDKPVKTLQMGLVNSSMYQSFGKICVYNQTSYPADIAKQLGIRPDVHIRLNKGPQVLIIHTHTTESYASSDTGYYNPNDPTRNPDKSKSVVEVGNLIAQQLEKNGIQVVHDTTYHDYPSYSNAYGKTLTSIEKDLELYPTIQVILDIHRDAIQYSDGTRAKPTAVINGKKAAQIMVVAPSNQAGSALPVPDWQYNYRFALRIQQALVNTYPGLARPLNLCPYRYNMQVSHGSLLVEFGTDVNTLSEAAYSGQLFGGVLSKVLLGLKG